MWHLVEIIDRDCINQWCGVPISDEERDTLAETLRRYAANGVFPTREQCDQVTAHTWADYNASPGKGRRTFRWWLNRFGDVFGAANGKDLQHQDTWSDRQHPKAPPGLRYPPNYNPHTRQAHAWGDRIPTLEELAENRDHTEIPASQLQAKVGVWNYSQQDLDRAVHYAINKRELPEFEARHANGKVTTNA